MAKSIFINLLHAEEKESGLAAAVGALSKGEECAPVHAIEPVAFGAIPGAPFAYWASDKLRSLFSTMSPLEGDGRSAKQGLATADDFRFVRAWWEVPPAKIVTGTAETTPEQFRAQTFQGKRWVPFAKGGAYSPYYADLHLVIDWERGGTELTAFAGSVIRNGGYYFRSGLTWPRRTNGLSFRAMPAGSIFADKGPGCFTKHDNEHLLLLAGVMNSSSFSALVQAMVARVSLAQSFEVGLIQKIPVPTLINTSTRELYEAVVDSIRNKMQLATADETNHLFRLPALLQSDCDSLLQRLHAWNEKLSTVQRTLADRQHHIDDLTKQLYGLAETDLATSSSATEMMSPTLAEEEDDTPDSDAATTSTESAAIDLISYVLGLLYGRWDIRTQLTLDKPAQQIAPFAPLPPCSPGMLTDPDGLPTQHATLPANYPLDIAWAGVIPADEGHAHDIVSRLRLGLSVLFPNPHAIEQELCQLLGVKQLGTWLGSKFSPIHIKRYSKSKRKAPIYWQLRSSKKHYGLWLYYPRLNKDTLYVALRDYVGPKLAHEEESLQAVNAQLAEAKLSGTLDEPLMRQAEMQEEVVQDVAAFRDELKAIADAGYDPDLNDGVLINLAPLHRLVPWKEAAARYKELKAGKYPWSSMQQRYTFR